MTWYSRSRDVISHYPLFLSMLVLEYVGNNNFNLTTRLNSAASARCIDLELWLWVTSWRESWLYRASTVLKESDRMYPPQWWRRNLSLCVHVWVADPVVYKPWWIHGCPHWYYHMSTNPRFVYAGLPLWIQTLMLSYSKTTGQLLASKGGLQETVRLD